MTWRESAAARIAEIVATPEYRAADERGRKRILSEAYPWGERRMLPYKVWGEECRRVLTGHTKPKVAAERRARADADATLFRPE
jgi:ABC-type ATPase with predicted acetyltransferase domain